MRRIHRLLLALLLATPAAAGAGEECAIELARVDAGVGTFVASCRWAVAPRFVAGIVGDSRRVAEASTSLAESRKLSDGRVVNVHSPGWPISDRQSTLAIEKTPLAEGGLVLVYRLAPRQEPLGRGCVQALRDEGRWDIRGDGAGGTSLRYESRYDPGGDLPLGLVRRTVRSSIEESLDEILAAARAAEERASSPRS